MKSFPHRQTKLCQTVALRSVLGCLTIIALATFFTVAPNSITKGEEQQSSKNSTPKDSPSNSSLSSKAETNSTDPPKETTGMSTSSMEYEPMYPANKPDWIFKDPYWNSDQSTLVVHVGGELEASAEAIWERRIEGSIDALCSQLDKYFFKQPPASNQIPEIVSQLRKRLAGLHSEYESLHVYRLESAFDTEDTEGTVLEVNTAEGKRYQLWRRIEFHRPRLEEFQYFHNKARHPERFRNVGVGFLSILVALELTHVGVRTLGRKKNGKDTFQATTYR
jgi:hypothetical protein